MRIGPIVGSMIAAHASTKTGMMQQAVVSTMAIGRSMACSAGASKLDNGEPASSLQASAIQLRQFHVDMLHPLLSDSRNPRLRPGSMNAASFAGMILIMVARTPCY